MKKLLGYGIAFVLLIGALFLPALAFDSDGADRASEPTTITDYHAVFDLDDDGDLHAVETLRVDFSNAPGKHGIFRFWDRLDPSAPHDRRIVKNVEVTQDGEPAEVDMSREQNGRFDVARIGDPNRILSTTEHTYVISYDIDGVITPGDGVAESSRFYWNLIPSGWQQNIEASHLEVNLPTSGQEVKCFVGAGETQPSSACDVQGEGTSHLVISTGALPRNTPVTIVTGLELPTPDAGTHVPWTARFDPVLGQNVWLLVGTLLLALLAGLGAWAWARRTRESDPQFPLMYAPPEGIGPAQGAYLLTEDVDRTAYVASLMHAAQNGAVELGKDGDAWSITDKGGPQAWDAVDPVTRRVAHLLGGPGTTFSAGRKDVEAGKRLKTEIDGFNTEVKTWALTSGNLVKVPMGSLGGFSVVAGLGLAAANLIWHPFYMSMLGLVPGAFAIMAAPFVRTGASTKRTPQGRELWSRLGGFRRILSTPSAQDRFDFAGRENLYIAYVPWAVAFGCADAWAAKYRTEMGHEPPMPSYFGGYYAGTMMGTVDSIVSDFDSTVSSAISSYNATQSSSSSGGGGFSGGGGGGGGGGGSW